MQLEVPYSKLDPNSTSGPAVLHMVTRFYQRPHSARAIQRMVNTDPHRGTKNAELEAAAGEMGFDILAKGECKTSEIRKFLDEGRPVVINFLKPGSINGHYSLAIGMDEENMIFNDPILGAGYKMPIKEFETRWKSGHDDKDCWFMVMTPKAE